MDRIGDHHIKLSKPSSERQRSLVFSYVESKPKGKCVYKYTYDCIYMTYTYIYV
jgi:hypothetical protein